MIDNFGLGNCVTLTGYVPGDRLADHYRMANVFAMPSRGEGFGIVFLEAMACGVPVLAGNQDGSVDALAQGELGRLVDPTNIDAIASGIVDLLSQRGPAWWYQPEELRGRMLARFGRDVFGQKLCQVIESVSCVG